MKKLFLPLLVLGAAISHASADISIDFTFGVLADAVGNPIADGSLFQIIASPDATFSAPTSTDFLGGSTNDVLLWSGSFDSATFGLPGAMLFNLHNINLTNYPVANDKLIVRWYPSLTTAASTPGSTSYGEYGYANDNSWVAPSDGNLTSPSFLTISAGGTSPNSLGEAINVTAVPEPSSYAALVALFSIGLLIKHWRRKDSHA